MIERVKARRLDRNAQFAVVAAREAWADSGLADVELDKDAARRRDRIRHRWPAHHAVELRRAEDQPAPGVAAGDPDADAELGRRQRRPRARRAGRRAHPGLRLRLRQRGDLAGRRPDPARPRRHRASPVATEGSIAGLPLAAFGQMMALSKRNDDPERASRPWDVDRDGFLLGEGAGVLVLEIVRARDGPRREDLRRVRRRRHHRRRPRHRAARPDRFGRRARDAAGAARGRPRHRRHRAHQRARDLDPAGRRRRVAGDPARRSAAPPTTRSRPRRSR